MKETKGQLRRTTQTGGITHEKPGNKIQPPPITGRYTESNVSSETG